MVRESALLQRRAVGSRRVKWGAGLASSHLCAHSVHGTRSVPIDALLGLAPLWTPAVSLAVLAAGIAGGAANLALRRTVAPAPA